MKILGIETSCDECSLAIVEDGVAIIGMVTASQIATHAPFRGVVPEFASRAHVQSILSCYWQLMKEGGERARNIDAIAVTTGPGLTGSLMVGLSFAQSLSFGLGVPIVAINHILAHLYAARMEADIPYPSLGVVVSGGHTLIGVSYSAVHFEMVGQSVDDACGEVFDKIAVHLGLGYPGGPAIERHARLGSAESAAFPCARLANRCDLSFSGLKSAVIHQCDTFWNDAYQKSTENISAAFQRAALTIVEGAIECAVERTSISTVVIGGGVVANAELRSRLDAKQGLSVYYPSLPLCGDNGAMIAGLAAHYPQVGESRGRGVRRDVYSRASFPNFF